MSTDTKHTPGKWRIGHQTDYGVFNPSVIQTGEDIGIATVYGIPLHVKLDEVEKDPKCAEGLANARLIAAAPELLWALKSILDDLPIRRDWLDPELEGVARALLAEIEGAQ